MFNERPRLYVDRTTRPMYQREFASAIAGYWSQLPENSNTREGVPIEDIGEAAGRFFRGIVESRSFGWLGVYAFSDNCDFYVLETNKEGTRGTPIGQLIADLSIAIRGRAMSNMYHLIREGLTTEQAPEVALREFKLHHELDEATAINVLWESEIGVK